MRSVQTQENRGESSQMNREDYEHFKATTMQNGGKSLLTTKKEEIEFDPSNPVHMEAADLMFSPEPSTDDATDAERPALLAQRRELVEKRRAIPFKFKLQPPYMDLRSLVLGRTMQWAIQLHRKGLVKKATVLPLPNRAEFRAKKDLR